MQATETSTGVSHDVKSMAEAVRATDAIFVVDAITGLGTSTLDIDGWGLDVVIGGSQKAVMIPPGLAFASVSQKAWARREKASQPYFYLRSCTSTRRLRRRANRRLPRRHRCCWGWPRCCATFASWAAKI